MTVFLSSKQVSDRLGVGFWRIRYAHDAGHVPEPVRVGNTRFYAEDDMLRLATYFASKGGDNDQQVRDQQAEF